ncbi:MAG: mandelate racemase/muconate lactonizing enzyme family protein [Proteobacteria bacterium]|nr:mandelate racemase/muconate lactonizing enzyme family protein [Pseudomonadota bacterium]MBI3498311.1 mandelate racemase/muconate lactonizing enzyme family protein [Pseudomonadota bacterium]
MKITRIRTGIVNLPADEPLANAPDNPSGKRPIVWLTVATDAGAEGLGVTYFGAALTGTLRHAIDALGQLCLGEDPIRLEAVHQKLRDAAGSSAGPGGIYHLALSALDMALWDIRGKSLGLPLWKLLGGLRDRVPTYASGALMRGLPLDRVVKAAATLKDKGWCQMKTQLALPGETTPEKEVERMRLIREAIGPDIKLMCDINQRWRPEQAMDIGRRIEDAGVGLFWLEDVTAADDFAGLARVADALATPVAGGEYVWGIVPFRHMMERHSVDIPMIDLVRVGGITQWMKVAGMAEAFNLPVVSHLIPEVHVHLIGAIPNGLTVEYMPWLTPLFKEVPVQQNGELTMPSKPGLSLEFDQAALKRYDAG